MKKVQVKPNWFFDLRTLNKWRDVQGILFLNGHQCQIVVCSGGQPHFIWLQKPIRIIEEDGVIVGTFAANEHIRETERKMKLNISPYDWKCAGYMRGLSAFVLNVELTELPIFDTMPNSRYLDFDERNKLEDKIATVLRAKEKQSVG